MKKRSKIARDLATPKYRQRVIDDKRKQLSKAACRRKNIVVHRLDYDALMDAINNPCKPPKSLMALMRFTPPWKASHGAE